MSSQIDLLLNLECGKKYGEKQIKMYYWYQNIK